MFKRKRLPADLIPAHAAFHGTLVEVEAGKAALAGVMPTTRLPGRPLPDALLEFEDRLEAAGAGMAAWHARPIESEWRACSDGLEKARDRARRFREEGPDLGGFEGLIWAVEELLSPLEPFEAAAVAFRGLRTSSS
ncbi:MAG: hypothetical protein QOI81_2253 [Actinomycetota bacterium]|jgi:hypothetical protein|nr:hypothetical protein [Actinomycetota bacterium]